MTVRAASVAGLVIRPYAGEDDIPALVQISNAEFGADGVDERLTVEGERAWLANPSEQFEPRRDVAFAELDGRVVGVVFRSWADSRDGTVREYRVGGAVEPSVRGRGIGRALLAENERRWRQLAASHETDRPRVFTGFAGQGRPGERLLRGAGYIPVRWFFDMVRPTLNDLPTECPRCRPGSSCGQWRGTTTRPSGRQTERRSATTGAGRTSRRRRCAASSKRRTPTRRCG